MTKTMREEFDERFNSLYFYYPAKKLYADCGERVTLMRNQLKDFIDSQLHSVFVKIEKTLIRDIDADDVCDVDDLLDLQYMKLKKLRLKYCKMRPYEDESNYEFKICPECGRSSIVYKILNKCPACIAKKLLDYSNSELPVKEKK